MSDNTKRRHMRRPAGVVPSGAVRLTEFRARIGEYLFAVGHGQSFVLTRRGKELAHLVPMDDATVILPDGTVIGEMPLTAWGESS